MSIMSDLGLMLIGTREAPLTYCRTLPYSRLKGRFESILQS